MPDLLRDYIGPIITAPLGPCAGTAPDLRSLWCKVILGKLLPFSPLPFVGLIAGIRKVSQKAANVHVQLSSLTVHPAQPFKHN